MPEKENLNTENSEKIRWEWKEVYPEEVVLAENIRPIDSLVVEDLAMSIAEVGQLQPCLGDIIEIDGEITIRLIAGQHRYYAISLLCEKGLPRPIIMRVADRTLSPEEILSVQMSENLQNKMTPEQDAVAIHSFWIDAKRIYGENSLTIKDLARRLGRSPRKISDAIKYVEGLSPKVQQMVHAGVLPYSTALLLERLGRSDTDDFHSEQVRTAIFLISQKYTTEQAKKYLERKSKEAEFSGPLFGDELWKELKKNGHRIAIRDSASREGRMAVGWFQRMLKSVSILDDPSKAEFSEAIQTSVEELGISLEDFFKNLDQMNVQLNRDAK